MSEAEKLRDLLTNAQMPDNATLTVTLGELRAAFGSSDPEAVGLDALLTEIGRVAIGVVNDWIGDPDYGHILDPLVAPVEAWRARLAKS
jgi:hypothetical protein